MSLLISIIYIKCNLVASQLPTPGLKLTGLPPGSAELHTARDLRVSGLKPSEALLTLQVTSASKASVMGPYWSPTVFRLLIKIFNVQVTVQFYQL